MVSWIVDASDREDYVTICSMDSLSDKLKSLGVKVGAGDVRPPAPRKEGFPIEEVVSGRSHATIYGDAYRVETLYPHDYTHGSAPLQVRHPLHILAEWGGVPQVAGADLHNFVFLDTETTGLAGGTGTFAFLVGLGRFTSEGFQVAQFFLREPSEEIAVLAAVSEYLDPCQAVVTYNGKGFDIPLLTTRYTLQALSFPLAGTPHIDLLPLARRLWRDRLPSRRLGFLESAVLGASRTQEEVPGWLIPQYYYDYLKSGDARPLAGVFYHNAIDIVSLAALFAHTAGLLADPLALHDQPGLDIVALARLYEDLGHLDVAVQLYEHGLGAGVPEEFYWQTIERYSFLFKRQRAWGSATELWKKAAGHGELYAFTELAKYYEHEARLPGEALAWTKAAIERASRPDFPLYLRKLTLPELQHRLSRLQTRLS